MAGHGTRAVFLMQMPFGETPINFVLEDPNVQLTRVGNVWSNLSMSCGDPEDNWLPDSVTQIVAGMDALRRLARIDLQVHYPELGVKGTCGA